MKVRKVVVEKYKMRERKLVSKSCGVAEVGENIGYVREKITSKNSCTGDCRKSNTDMNRAQKE